MDSKNDPKLQVSPGSPKPVRHVVQLRKDGESRWFSPNRDITVVTPIAFKAVFKEFDEPLSQRVSGAMLARGLELDTIGELARDLGKLVNEVPNKDRDVDQMLSEFNLDRFRPGMDVVAMLLLSKWLRAYILGYRDTLHEGDLDDPLRDNLHEMVDQFMRTANYVEGPRKPSLWQRIKNAWRHILWKQSTPTT